LPRSRAITAIGPTDHQEELSPRFRTIVWGARARSAPYARGCVTRTVLRGAVLARARKAAGWTQPQLASRLGASGRLRVGQWERGLEQPQPRYVLRLATVFQLNPMELLTVDPQNPPLKALRLAVGLTLTETAAATGMTYSTYYRLENGMVRGDPSAQTARAVAQVLSVDAAAVLRAVEQSRICRAVAAAPVDSDALLEQPAQAPGRRRRR